MLSIPLVCLLMLSTVSPGCGGPGPSLFVAPATGHVRGRGRLDMRGSRALRTAGRAQGGDQELLDLYMIEERPPSNSTREVALKSMQNLRRFLEARPVSAYNRQAFEVGKAAYEAHCDAVGERVPVVLDSCCGTGRSSRMLAEARPGKFVVGIDRSLARLERNIRFREGPARGAGGDESSGSNLVLLRGTCVDLWRSVWEEGWEVSEHYLLYPNPYPKHSDLRKRWHGSPGFPLLFALGGSLEVRASWRTYLEEFAIAADAVTGGGSRAPPVREIPPGLAGLGSGGALTNFEAKYLAAGVPIFGLAYGHRERAPPDDFLCSGSSTGEG